MYKRDLQREINWREERDTLKANAWLRSEGIAPETLAKIDSQLVKAQHIAHKSIKHHRELRKRVKPADWAFFRAVVVVVATTTLKSCS